MDFEFDILDAIQKLRTPLGDILMPFFSSLGDAGIIWILMAILLFIIPKTRKYGACMAIALLFDVILCNGLMKNLVARTRPYDIRTTVELIIAKPSEYSFPSGHTAASFASVFALAFSKNKLWIPSFVLAVIIAFSRMYLYVHFPTDIAGGILVGLVCGALAACVTPKLFACYNKNKLR